MSRPPGAPASRNIPAGPSAPEGGSRCTRSSSSATARASGTSRTASPAGPTSTSPTKGREEAREAGRLLRDGGYDFDVAYTSVLKRAIRTLWLALDEMDRMWIPVIRAWRLNERHYGALQGLNKAETAAKFGEDQVKIWRRSYSTPPPVLTPEDERFPGHDRRYAVPDEGGAAAHRVAQGDRRPRRSLLGETSSRRR